MKEALMVQAFAVYAEIEGMKAENKFRELRGETPAYIGEDFFKLSAELDKLALELKKY